MGCHQLGRHGFVSRAPGRPGQPAGRCAGAGLFPPGFFPAGLCSASRTSGAAAATGTGPVVAYRVVVSTVVVSTSGARAVVVRSRAVVVRSRGGRQRQPSAEPLPEAAE